MVIVSFFQFLVCISYLSDWAPAWGPCWVSGAGEAEAGSPPSAPLMPAPFFDSQQSASPAVRRTECKVFSKTRTKAAAAEETRALQRAGGPPPGLAPEYGLLQTWVGQEGQEQAGPDLGWMRH